MAVFCALGLPFATVALGADESADSRETPKEAKEGQDSGEKQDSGEAEEPALDADEIRSRRHFRTETNTHRVLAAPAARRLRSGSPTSPCPGSKGGPCATTPRTW
ncbi:MAG: hypothetical protein AAF517_28535, partial [Planctomycetota bacterium]